MPSRSPPRLLSLSSFSATQTPPPSLSPSSPSPPSAPSSTLHPKSPAPFPDAFHNPLVVPAPAQSTQSNDPPSSLCTRCTRSPPSGNPPPPISVFLASRTVYASHTLDTRPDFLDPSAASAPGRSPSLSFSFESLRRSRST